MKESTAYYSDSKYLSWSAIIIGALIAIGLSFLLNVFAAAIGLAAFVNNPGGTTTFTIGGFIGLVIGSFFAMFVAGWIAGYLGSTPNIKPNYGELYGFSAWCLALIISIFLVSNSTPFMQFNPSLATPSTSNTQASTNNNRPFLAAPLSRSEGLTTREAQEAARAGSYVALVTFSLFFIGALASCFGGRCGIVSKSGRKKEDRF